GRRDRPLAQARRGPRHPSAVGRGHRPAAGVNSGPPRARTSWSGGRDRQLHTRGHGAIGSAPASQAGGYGFESRWLHNLRRTRTPVIGGSWSWKSRQLSHREGPGCEVRVTTDQVNAELRLHASERVLAQTSTPDPPTVGEFHDALARFQVLVCRHALAL